MTTGKRNPDFIHSISSDKKKLQYCFASLIAITIAAAVIGKQFGSPEALGYATLLLAVPLWIVCMVLIFQLNRKVNSLPTALFRVLISLVPILALYIVYRTSYEVDQFLRAPA
jgi:hypothetical protein